MSDISNKVCIIYGASRGIGKSIAQYFILNNINIVICSKTYDTTTTNNNTNKLNGSIIDLYNELILLGFNKNKILALKCDVRYENDIINVIKKTLEIYKRIDYVIYNAGAISHNKVTDCTPKKYELMNSINSRGAYIMTYHLLKVYETQGFGKICYVSPPIYNRFFKGKTAYAMTKIGMTVLMSGLSMEVPKGVSVCSLWPATVIQSQVTENLNLPLKYMRKPEIFAEACLNILLDEHENINGKSLIDEDYLRTRGITDFTKYRCDKDFEPERMMPKEFPNLSVKEQNQQFSYQGKSKL